MLHRLKNWIIAGALVAGASLSSSLENKVNAQVYNTPGGRVAVEGPGYIREHEEEIHPSHTQPIERKGRHINYGGIKIALEDNASMIIENRSKMNLIPSITTKGFFKIKPGKIAGLEYTNEKTGVVADDSGDLRDATPAFQLIPQDAEGRQLGNKDVYFCDTGGHIYLTSMELVDDVWNGKRDIYRTYKFDRGDTKVLYFPTQAFACLTPREKARFWDKTTLFDQLSLRGAPLGELKRFTR